MMEQKARNTVEVGNHGADALNECQELRDQVEMVITRGRRCTILKNGLPRAAVVPLRDLERLLSMDAELDRRMILQEDQSICGQAEIEE